MKIIVSGFDVFRDYKANPSWQAVSELNPSKLSLTSEDELELLKIPVVYDDVQKAIQVIWNEKCPDLLIHCGVSVNATGMVLEKRAVTNLERYCSNDVQGCCPSSAAAGMANSCPAPSFIYTDIDVDKVCDQLNRAKNLPLTVMASERAGEYLCEFIYRCSLLHDKTRTLFIHVPETKAGVTVAQIAECLAEIIKVLVDQMKNSA